MLKLLIDDLADNFHNGDEKVLEEYINIYSSIASNSSNRKKDDEKLKPYIYNAVKQAYLRRGDEGLNSNGTGGMSYSYIDIEKKLADDVRKIRVIL